MLFDDVYKKVVHLSDWRTENISKLDVDEATILDVYYKLFNDSVPDLSYEARYDGDLKPQMRGGANELNIDVFAHELGHYIFFSQFPDRMFVLNWGMYVAKEYVFGHVVQAPKTTQAVENELATVAISVRLMEMIGVINALDYGHADINLIINEFNLAGVDYIKTPTANKFLRDNDYSWKVRYCNRLLRKIGKFKDRESQKFKDLLTNHRKLSDETHSLFKQSMLLSQTDRFIWALDVFQKQYDYFTPTFIKESMKRMGKVYVEHLAKTVNQ